MGLDLTEYNYRCDGDGEASLKVRVRSGRQVADGVEGVDGSVRERWVGMMVVGRGGRGGEIDRY